MPQIYVTHKHIHMIISLDEFLNIEENFMIQLEILGEEYFPAISNNIVILTPFIE